MARARMRTGLFGRRWWFPDVADDILLTSTEGADEPDLWAAFAALCSQPFDLTSSPPLRVLHIRLPAGDAVALAAHHVALDGLSVAMLLQAILERCASDGATELESSTVHGRMRATTRPRRPEPGHTETNPAGVIHASRPTRRLLPDLSALWQTTPSRVAVSTGRGMPGRGGRRGMPADRWGPGYGVHCDAVPVPKPGRPVAGGATVTINDLLLAAAQMAVERWNTMAGQATRQLRVRMPISLRQRGEESAIGNHTGEALITTGPSDRRDPATLLAVVCGQTAASKAGGPPPGTGDAVGGVARLPAPVRHALLRLAVTAARPVLMPTTSMTNLGRLSDRFSDQMITSLHFAAFAGPPQGLVIAAVGYGDELHLTFCYHRDLFDPTAASCFAQLFRAALDELTRQAAL